MRSITGSEASYFTHFHMRDGSIAALHDVLCGRVAGRREINLRAMPSRPLGESRPANWGACGMTFSRPLVRRVIARRWSAHAVMPKSLFGGLIRPKDSDELERK